MAKINSSSQYFREIMIPLAYTALFATIFVPPVAILMRHYIVKSGLPLKFRYLSEGNWKWFLTKLGPFRYGGRPIAKPGGGQMRLPHPSPVSLRSVHREAQHLMENRKAFEQGALNQNGYGLCLSQFRALADAWVCQTGPSVAIVGGLVGLLTPALMRERNFLQEDHFDWPPRFLMYVACTVFGSVVAWRWQNSLSAPLAQRFVVKLGGTSLGYIFPYLVLPIFANAAMFFAQQFIYDVNQLGSRR